MKNYNKQLEGEIMETINLADLNGKWIGEKAYDFLRQLNEISKTNKTKMLCGAYNVIKLLEFLPTFEFHNDPTINNVGGEYHKAGLIRESDFVKYEVYHLNDHDSDCNMVKMIGDDNLIDIKVIIDENSEQEMKGL